MTRLLQRLQRRALVVLTWLVLALSVAPAAEAHGGRAQAVLVAAALGTRAASVRTVPVARCAAVPRLMRVAVEPAVNVRGAPRAGAAAVSASAPLSPRLRDGRRLYLETARFLC